MKPLHYLQRQILNLLLFSSSMRFSDFSKKLNIENNLLTFHLKELQRMGLINIKTARYALTNKGKEYANTMDTDTAQIQKQAKISAVSCAYRKNKSNEYEFLIYTRLKHPFYEHQGFPSGKIKWGEQIKDACVREFKEETGMTAKPECFKIRHYLVYDKATGELIEDKLFFFFKIYNPKGELTPNNEGLYEWVKEQDVNEYIRKPFESKQGILDILNEVKKTNQGIQFSEYKQFTSEF